jgi:hypothetical protein
MVRAPLEAGDVVLAHYVEVPATRAPLGASGGRVGVNHLRVIGEPAAAVAWRRDRF